MVAWKPQIGRNSVAATSCSSAVLWPTRGLMASAATAFDLVVASHGQSGQWEWSADRSLRLVSHQPRIAGRKPKAFTFDAAADRRPRCSTAQRAWAMSSPTTRKHSLHPSKIHCFLYTTLLFSWHVNNRQRRLLSTVVVPLSLEFYRFVSKNTLHYLKPMIIEFKRIETKNEI